MAKKKEAEKKEAKSAKAVSKYLRISPRKMRLVLDAIRFKPTSVAFTILATVPRKAARMTEKTLKSAVANAKDLGLSEGKLYVSEIFAGDAPTMKRFRPRSMGRADRILKRMSHLSLVVTEGTKDWSGSSAVAEAEEAIEETKAKAKKPKAKKKAAPKTKKKAASAKA